MTLWLAHDDFEGDGTDDPVTGEHYPDFDIVAVLLDEIDQHTTRLGEIDAKAAAAVERLCFTLQQEIAKYKRIDMEQREREFDAAEKSRKQRGE